MVVGLRGCDGFLLCEPVMAWYPTTVDSGSLGSFSSAHVCTPGPRDVGRGHPESKGGSV